MKNFIKGMVFVALILPFLDGVLSIFNQSVEFVCTKIATETFKLKQELEEEPEEPVHAIGFQAPITSEEEYDEEEEE